MFTALEKALCWDLSDDMHSNKNVMWLRVEVRTVEDLLLINTLNLEYFGWEGTAGFALILSNIFFLDRNSFQIAGSL